VTGGAESRDAAQGGSPVVETRGLSKSYGVVSVLQDVSISIAPGEVIGLIGANGAGKSTFIKCLTGAVFASAGTVLVDGNPVDVRTPEDGLRHGLAAVQQEVNVIADHSVAENIMLGRFPSSLGFVSSRTMSARVRDLLDRVQLNDLDPETHAGALTPSAKRLVMVATVLAREPRVLILDEPTAALAPEESAVVAKLVRELSAAGIAVVYVSHRLHEVKDLCSRVIALRNGRQSGELAGDDVTRHNMLKLIGGKDEPDTLLVSEDHAHSEVREPGEVLLDVQGVSGVRVRGVSFKAYRGEVLGIAGLAGSGRSELLRLIYGLQPLTAGVVHYAGSPLGPSLRSRVRRRMGYVAELRAANVLRGLDVVRNLTCNSTGEHRRFRIFASGAWERLTTQRVAQEVRLVGRPEGPMENLSGGNQQKILISRWLERDTDLLILDEPTAGVDLLARADIHGLLHKVTEQGKTVLVASVEADELTTICDRVLVMVEGEIRAVLTPPFTEQELVNALFSHKSLPTAVPA
jgi:ribose transport system ATP-binding protein